MKIKRIEIQAFKAYLYKQDGTFDFMVDDQTPANFISIYAPNGFGKTAFYDAVDYCITHNINRHTRDTKVANRNKALALSINHKHKKQYLLRNQYADKLKETLPTIISVETTLVDFQSPRIKAIKGSKDYHLERNKTPLNRKFFHDVMLSQEGIDAFLREDSPVERYKKFIKSPQFNDLVGIDENRQSINSMLAIISEKEKTLGNDKAQVKEVLDNINVQKDVFIEASKLVDKLRLVGVDLPNIENPYSQVKKQQLDDRIKLIASEINEKEKNQQFETKLITVFSHNIDAYQSQYQEKFLRELELIALLKVINDKKEIDLKNQRHQSHRGQLNVLLEKQVALNEYLGQLPLFVEYKKKLVRLNKHISEQEVALLEHDSAIEFNTNNLAIFNGNLQKFIAEQQKLIELQTASKGYYLKLSGYKKEISANTKLIEGEETKQLEIQQIIKRIEAERKQTQSFSMRQLISNEADLPIKVSLNKLHREFQHEEGERIKLCSTQTRAQAELSTIQQQSSAIHELISQGLAIISKAQQVDCPLCLQPYQDFSALQKQVLNNPALDNAEKKILDDIAQIESQITSSKERLALFKSSYEKQITGVLLLLENKYSKQQELLNDSCLRQEKIGQKSEEIERSSELLLEKVRFKDTDQLKEYLETELAVLGQKIGQSQSDIKQYEGEIKKENDDKGAKSLSLSSLLAEQGQLSKNKEFNSLQECLDAQSIDKNAQLEILQEKLTALQSQNQLAQDSQRENIETLFSEIHGLEKSIPIEYQLQSIIEVKAIQSTKQQKLTDLLTVLATHEKAISCLAIDDLIKNGDWSSIKGKVSDTLSTLTLGIEENKQKISDMQLLSEFALDALNFCNKTELIEQKADLDVQINKLGSIRQELSVDLKNISQYLEKAIDKYFHTDLINQLYAAIDPHPDYKEIQFDCKIPETANKAELNITLKNPEDGSVISPNLYFSSAQINVLSLSIFLARALNVNDDNGNVVDCIFIDDPVQSMDSINVLGLIDLLRNLSTKFDKQFIISTHDENFHELLKKKIPAGSFNAKYFELESFGKVAE